MATALFDLTGEVAAVIGATGVLGGAIAEGLAAAGASVAVLGRDRARGDACVRRIQEAGGGAAFVPCDAMDRAALTAARAAIEECCRGPVTVLVNAVGGNAPAVTVTAERPVAAVAADDWRTTFDLNLVGGVLLPCQEFGPAMGRRGRGSIINIASVAGHVPLSRVACYAAAKAAVLNLSQFLAREWAPNGVRVNTITPGFFLADQNRDLLVGPDGKLTPRAAAIIAHTPLGRFGEPRELVGAAVFLASERASGFVTGSDLRVDGGFLSQTI